MKDVETNRFNIPTVTIGKVSVIVI